MAASFTRIFLEQVSVLLLTPIQEGFQLFIRSRTQSRIRQNTESVEQWVSIIGISASLRPPHPTSQQPVTERR